MANRKRLKKTAKDRKTYMFAFRYHVPDGCFNGLEFHIIFQIP